MAYLDYRLKLLLEQCENANAEGTLTKPMLDNAVNEFLAYKEPTASDVRNLLAGMYPGAQREEIALRLRQARRMLDLTAEH